MTKEKFLEHLAALYRVANLADCDAREMRADWTRPEMAATICRPLDKILNELENCGALSHEERQSFYDSL